MRFSTGVTANAGYVFSNLEAAALVARFTTPATNMRKAQIDTLVGALKTAGIWTKLDCLWVMAAADAYAAKLNWLSTSFNLTAVNSPAFVSDAGFSGDGLMSYLDTGFNPASAPSPKFTLNDATLALWSLTNSTNAGGQSFELGSQNAYMNRQISGTIGGRVNTGSGIATIVTGPLPGLVGWSRTSSNSWSGYKNGAKTNSGSDASASIPVVNLRISSTSGTQFGVNQNAVVAVGQGLSDQNWSDLYAALQTYLHAVGAV